ncbi:MAG: CoA-transferase [Thermodesulfobacteriota bacterium]|nr:CoA-transferase [Thermodesulfobacteriota bacterium]
MLGHFKEPWFQPEFSATPSKVMPLTEAVRQFIRPGMLVHMGMPGVRWPSAILYEIARQFWGKEGSLQLSAITVNLPAVIPIQGRIFSKIICSYAGDPYYSPSPNVAVQRAIKRGHLDIENWSILSLPLRLQAAAMGLPFFPTHSILGSSMEEENKESFIAIDDPFGSHEKVGLVKALAPDVTILHGWMADQEGNALFLPPYSEQFHSAMASKEGVVLAVEKIVSSKTIREHNHFVRLPGIYVKSVSEVPFGAHPAGLSRIGMKGMDLYGEDYDFVEEGHQAAKTDESFDKWIDDWVLSINGHEEYLEKLGHKRLMYLKGMSHFDTWRSDIKSIKKISKSSSYTSVEMSVVALSRKLAETILRNQYKTMLVGAGIANLAGWLCFYNLRKQGYEINLMAEIGLYGYVPQPLDPSLFNYRNFPNCKMVADIQTIIGTVLGGSQNRCIGALGAAEVDKEGNLNSTRSDDGSFVVGSGGANDVASSSREVMVIMGHSKKRLKEELTYVTSPGKKVTALVTTRGIFEKLGDDHELTLTSVLPRLKDTVIEDAVQTIKDHCGWHVKESPLITCFDPPERSDLELMRSFDPNRYYLGKGPEK